MVHAAFSIWNNEWYSICVISNIVLEALRQAQKSNISGLLYSGVGLGIFTSSIYIF